MDKIFQKVLSISQRNNRESSLRVYNCGFENEEVVVKKEENYLIIRRVGIGYVGKTKKLTYQKQYNFVQMSFNEPLPSGKYELSPLGNEDELIFNLSMPICKETNVELNGIDDEEFEVICGNGNGIAVSSKSKYILEYPKIEDLMPYQIENALMYRGLELNSVPTYGDIMILFGLIKEKL